MGTASLVFGLLLIGAGLYVIFSVETKPYSVTDEKASYEFTPQQILGIPCIVVGGLLMRSYYSERKKDQMDSKSKSDNV